MQLVLFEPEIPPNTGNIARLCAATDTELHLIEPLGFSLEDKYMKRAGLDYWPYVQLHIWPNFTAYYEQYRSKKRFIASSSKRGGAMQNFAFSADDAILLGPETRGLPNEIIEQMDACVTIPLATNHVRSLNLSTAAGILLYFALASSQQLAFPPFLRE